VTATVEDEVARGRLVRLRRKRLSDAPNDYAWRRDEELARYDAASPLRASYADFLALYEEELKYPSPFRRTLAIEDLQGNHIGNVMYYNIDERRGEAELGITIGDRRYWGRGYGRDAVETLVRYVFGTTGLRRIFLNTLDWNERAQRSFLAAGFRPCGTTRRGVHVFLTMEFLKAWLDRRDDAQQAGARGR
jgi:RimJ/RimL family protein N-acetyltransferase